MLSTGTFFQRIKVSSKKYTPPRHPEEIMAAVVVACKLCNDWMEWVGTMNIIPRLEPSFSYEFIFAGI